VTTRGLSVKVKHLLAAVIKPMKATTRSLLERVVQLLQMEGLFVICMSLCEALVCVSLNGAPCIVLGALAIFFAFAQKFVVMWFRLRFHESSAPSFLGFLFPFSKPF
jgi:uncharacterized membrane protein